MKKITGLEDINHNTKEGQLLFTALTILTTEVFPDKTPGQVIEILNTRYAEIMNDEK